MVVLRLAGVAAAAVRRRALRAAPAVAIGTPACAAVAHLHVLSVPALEARGRHGGAIQVLRGWAAPARWLVAGAREVGGAGGEVAVGLQVRRRGEHELVVTLRVV